MLIKVVDRLHNMQTIQFMNSNKQQKISEETLNSILYAAVHLNKEELISLLTKLSTENFNIKYDKSLVSSIDDFFNYSLLPIDD